MRNWTIAIFLLLISMHISANEYIGLSMGGETNDSDSRAALAELNYVGRHNKNVSIYLGWAWRNVGSDAATAQRDKFSLLGTQAGFQVHPNFSTIKPFIGLGLYTSQVRLCEAETADTCAHQHSLALFPEVGLHISPVESLEFTLKARQYYFDRSYLANDRLFAVSISFYFR